MERLSFAGGLAGFRKFYIVNVVDGDMRGKGFLLGFVFLLVVSFVSAGWFGDFFGKITGNVVSEDNLVGYWNFEDNVLDSSGNGNNGVNNGASFVEGKVGRGLNFDGNDDYVNIPVVATSTPFSVCAWAKSNNDMVLQDVFSMSESTTDVGDTFRLSLSGTTIGDPVLATVRNGGSWVSASTNTGYTTNKWHHVCAVFTNSTLRTAYIDGGSEGTERTSRTPVNMNVAAIGRLSRLNPAVYFDGLIDEVKVWDRALSAEEILGEYCTEDWQCGSWSSCFNGQQTRICSDSNLCGTNVSKPTEVQSCCSPNCGDSSDWSSCFNGQQTRTCSDSNLCGTSVSKPTEVQSCCSPNCGDSACGDDGCGGSCGTCSVGSDCIDKQCVEKCVDDDGDEFFVQLVPGSDCGLADCDDDDARVNPGEEEVCGNNIDEDCDGSTDEDCSCLTGTNKSCGTTNVGECSYGVQDCVDSEWGNCTGNVEPVDEICDNLDNNCNGEVDENLVNTCGTSDVGECRLGIELCSAGSWIGCNSIEPITEFCKDGKDNDCNGEVDEVGCSLDCRGCVSEDNCLNTGIRLTVGSEAMYCERDGEIKSQKAVEDVCQNNYECLSNQCSDGVCVGLVEEIRAQTGLLWRILCTLFHPISEENRQECVDKRAELVV